MALPSQDGLQDEISVWFLGTRAPASVLLISVALTYGPLRDPHLRGRTFPCCPPALHPPPDPGIAPGFTPTSGWIGWSEAAPLLAIPIRPSKQKLHPLGCDSP